MKVVKLILVSPATNAGSERSSSALRKDMAAYPRGGVVLAMLGYPGMCHFPGYTFCPKILKQDILLFPQKFLSGISMLKKNSKAG